MCTLVSLAMRRRFLAPLLCMALGACSTQVELHARRRSRKAFGRTARQPGRLGASPCAATRPRPTMPELGHGDAAWQARLHHQAGRAASGACRYDAAEFHFRQAITLAQRSTQSSALSYKALIDLYERQGKTAQALAVRNELGWHRSQAPRLRRPGIAAVRSALRSFSMNSTSSVRILLAAPVIRRHGARMGLPSQPCLMGSGHLWRHGRHARLSGRQRTLGTQPGAAFPDLSGRGAAPTAPALGARLLNTDRLDFDIGFALSLPARSSDVPARRGMPDLGTLVGGAPEIKLAEPTPHGRLSLELPLRAVIEARGGLRRRGATFEPRLAYRLQDEGGAWHLDASLGAVLGNAAINDYFYGVAPTLATPRRPSYAAKSGLMLTRLGLGGSYLLQRDWRAFAFLRTTTTRAPPTRQPLLRRVGSASARHRPAVDVAPRQPARAGNGR